ncbi:MAG: elongation factor EF-2 [Candidatus Thermoplasmatota archaeon]|nr:elongation factor EF-2 [Candidatus Thermoplasmatota archaeon]
MTRVREDLAAKIPVMMHKTDMIRNIGIVAHIHHGKTTLSDNLLAAAGMISEEIAGKQLYLNFDEQEQARCLTINNADVSIVHEFEGKEYLINLIDTPGHVDFGGDVTRAMRAVDGAVVLVCSVEGVMAQTETVLRQALKEKVKPVLFISKVDRAIKELKLTPEQMIKRFTDIIRDVNILIDKMVPDEFKDKWHVGVMDGSVAFGSAYENWALSMPYMKKTGVTFKDIFDLCSTGRSKELAQKAKINDVVFDMVVKHLPNPKEAQHYRLPQIWKGDTTQGIGKEMLACTEKAQTSYMVTDITIDPHAGEIATGRLFSGKLVKGMDLYVAGTNGKQINKVQSVSLFMGPERLPVEEVVAGNIAACTGLKDAIAGVSLSTDPTMEPFEEIRHVSEPVVTVAIETKKMGDLPKLIEVMRKVAKEDASLKVEINQETGEHLLSGMGELHIEITTFRIINDYKVDIKVSEPVVVYRETVLQRGPEFEGKSPNKHNKFSVIVEPLPEAVIKAIKDGTIPADKRIKDKKALAKTLEELGFDKDESKSVVTIHKDTILLDMTKGIQYLNETMELFIQGFEEAINKGPRANEQVMGLKVMLVDAALHEDAIHRGPAQSIPASRNAVNGAMVATGVTLLEPMHRVELNVPSDVVGNVIQELQHRRAVIENIDQHGDMSMVVGKAPVAEMFGFASAIRSACAGKVLWSTSFAGFEPLPRELMEKVTTEIRTRKGLKPEPPTAMYYAE